MIAQHFREMISAPISICYRIDANPETHFLNTVTFILNELLNKDFHISVRGSNLVI